jgi:hypothetical protein
MRGVYVTPQQAEILRALTRPPYAVLVRAAHSVGKTFISALAASWFYDRYAQGICLTTAPTIQQVRDLLFRELRLLRPGDPGWLPKDTRLQDSNDHFIHGLTANKPDAFQGRHAKNMMVVFDEAAGVEMPFWERALTMINIGKPGHYFLGIFNPYEVSCPAYQFEQSGRFTILDMSALDHPNVVDGVERVPGAVTREYVVSRMAEECRLLPEGDEAPPNSFTWENRTWIPESPLFEVQILGRWPSRATCSVWSDIALANIQHPVPLDQTWLTQIGCDPARFGDDRTAICVRRGRCIVHLESHRGWPLKQTASRLKKLAIQFAGKGQDPTQVPVLIDAAGLGAGLAEMNQDGARRFNFVEINSAMRSRWEAEWPNIRSELWFCASAMGEEGQISIAMLPEDIRAQLMGELRQPVFTLDALQRRVVEAKASTKKRLRASPDLADSFNLACMLKGSGWVESVTGRM